MRADKMREGTELFFLAASAGLAGVILILALCDLEILFTSYSHQRSLLPASGLEIRNRLRNRQEKI
jgi:hypothetical protein